MYLAYLISLGLVFIFSFALGIFTILINPKSQVHQLWFLTTIGASIWSGGIFCVLWFTPDKYLGLLFTKILHVGSTMIILFFFQFALTFLMKLKENKFLVIINYCIGLFFIVTIFASSLFIKGVVTKIHLGLWVEGGLLYPFYAAYYLLFVLMSIRFLYKGFKDNEGLKKRQIFFILLAIIIGFSGGMTNFLPQLFNIYPFGTFVVFLYPVLITYGIFLKKY